MPFAFMAGIGFVAVLPVLRIHLLQQPLWQWSCSVPKWRYFLLSVALRHIFFQAIPEFIMPSESVMQKVANTARLSRQTCVFLKFPLLAGRSIPLYPLTKTKYKKTEKRQKSHNGEF
jgi:hypothetical protein